MRSGYNIAKERLSTVTVHAKSNVMTFLMLPNSQLIGLSTKIVCNVGKGQMPEQRNISQDVV